MAQEQTQDSSRPWKSRVSKTYLPIEDYAIIGNLYTVALVGKNGSIDWCCIPRFDAPSVFGALLDAEKGGFFRIAPPDTPGMERKQLYLPDTNILITRFLTIDGVGEIIDFMPIKQAGSASHEHHLMRSVQVVRGSLAFELVCRPAFNYARDTHATYLSEEGAVFTSESLCLSLASSVPLEEDGQGGVRATFTLHQGQSAHFQLESARDQDIRPHDHSPSYYEDTFLETKRYWQTWLSRCQYQGRWREMVHRSALVLKLLTYAPTGAIVAAPTTSLPETIGGTRNWDYRYTWLRDATFTLYALNVLGFTDEARAFTHWLRRLSYANGEDLQIMYGIRGERDLTERTLTHLSGCGGTRPVRIGNGAASQKQLDVFGEVLDCIHLYRRQGCFERYGDTLDGSLWMMMRELVEHVCAHWHEVDSGIWEVRGGDRHYVYSKVMCWVALDRGIRAAQQRNLEADLPRWCAVRDQIRADILSHGYNTSLGAFTQAYDESTLDASNLMLPLVGFLPPDDPRMRSTVDRIMEQI